ncbi:MAG TPA: class III extradiol ring-cleavage dioxygenase, partial [Steroidobacteraceae bacterium]|nr:class III extradiol ring-cleavage dioxygenase [Steroidobacteraceae bacterium]
DARRLRSDGTVDTGPGVNGMFMDWPHASPNPWDPLAAFLRGLAATIRPAPQAVLVVSGHWEEDPVSVNAQARPPLLYDYYGFPPHTYRLRYPAPGDPALAQEILRLLVQSGIPARTEARRGLDHGVFVPFLLVYPQAEMPIVQVSLRSGLDGAQNLALGAALAPLRRQGVLIVGSGMSFHNLGVRSIANTPIPESEAFDAWLGEAVCTADPAARSRALREWSSAPAARFAHPRAEHLLPLMVAAGAAGEDRGERVFNDVMLGWRISGFRFG